MTAEYLFYSIPNDCMLLCKITIDHRFIYDLRSEDGSIIFGTIYTERALAFLRDNQITLIGEI